MDRDFWRVRAASDGPTSTDPEIVSSYVLSRFREPREDVERLVRRPRRKPIALVEQIAGRDAESKEDRTDAADQLRGQREAGCADPTGAREARNAINTAMLEELLVHLTRAKEDKEARVLVISSNDHLGLSAGADVKEELDEQGRVRRMELFARALRRADQLSEAHGRRLPRLGGGRWSRDRGRLRSAGGRLESQDALPGRRARSAGRPGPAGHALRPRHRQVPAAHLSQRQRGRGSSHGASPPGRAGRRAPRTRPSTSPREVAAHPPEAVARLKAMLHRWDGVVERSADEGRGQVEWQRTGPGLPFREHS